jgi:hypothetical protein
MQKTISVPKAEYERLHQMARQFELVQNIFLQTFLVEPSTKDIPTVMNEFKKTKKYKPAFLKSLEQGLRSSSYFSAK